MTYKVEYTCKCANSPMVDFNTVAFSRVTNASGPLPQATTRRTPTCSLSSATGSNQAKGKIKPTLTEKSFGGWMRNQVATYLGQDAGCTLLQMFKFEKVNAYDRNYED